MSEQTNITRIRPALASKRLDLPSLCDICGFAQSTRRHQACSKLRQQRKAEEWAALMEEKLAARAAREKRYAR